MLATWPVHPQCGRAFSTPIPIAIPDLLPDCPQDNWEGLPEPNGIAQTRPTLLHEIRSSAAGMQPSTSQFDYLDPMADFGLSLELLLAQCEYVNAYREPETALPPDHPDMLNDFDMAGWINSPSSRVDLDEQDDPIRIEESSATDEARDIVPNFTANIASRIGFAQGIERIQANDLSRSGDAVISSAVRRETPAVISRAAFVQRFRSATPEPSQGALNERESLHRPLPQALANLHGTIVYAIEDDDYPGFVATAWTDSNVTVIGVSDASGTSNMDPPPSGSPLVISQVAPLNSLACDPEPEDATRRATSESIESARRSGQAVTRLVEGLSESLTASRHASVQSNATIRPTHVLSRRRPHSPDEADSERVPGRQRTVSPSSLDPSSDASPNSRHFIGGPYRGSTNASASTSSLASSPQSGGGQTRSTSVGMDRDHSMDVDDPVRMNDVFSLSHLDIEPARGAPGRHRLMEKVKQSTLLIPASRIDPVVSDGLKASFSEWDTSGPSLDARPSD